jgi:hypothetical protein
VASIDSPERPNWDRVRRNGLAAGAAGLIVCALGASIWPGAFLGSYLVAWLFWLGIAVGGLAVIMVAHLTGGYWALAVRRVLESGARTLPLLLLLFVPVLFGMKDIYQWVRPEGELKELLYQPGVDVPKGDYLSVQGFVIRAAVYFAIWLLLAFLLVRWSTRHDASADPRLPRRMALLSGPGLVLYVLTATFAAVDWIMSLQPGWYSTIFGFIYIVTQAMTAFAFALVMLRLLAPHTPLGATVVLKTLRDLGSLMLALVMFWAYVAFSQFLLIWCGNLPEETAWYEPRTAGVWGWLAVALILFQFFLPFLLLLTRQVKWHLPRLAGLSALILVMMFVNLFWQVVPALSPTERFGYWPHLVGALAAMAGIGGLWLALFVGQLHRSALVPLHVPLPPQESHHG